MKSSTINSDNDRGKFLDSYAGHLVEDLQEFGRTNSTEDGAWTYYLGPVGGKPKESKSHLIKSSGAALERLLKGAHATRSEIAHGRFPHAIESGEGILKGMTLFGSGLRYNEIMVRQMIAELHRAHGVRQQNVRNKMQSLATAHALSIEACLNTMAYIVENAVEDPPNGKFFIELLRQVDQAGMTRMVASRNIKDAIYPEDEMIESNAALLRDAWAKYFDSIEFDWTPSDDWRGRARDIVIGDLIHLMTDDQAMIDAWRLAAIEAIVDFARELALKMIRPYFGANAQGFSDMSDKELMLHVRGIITRMHGMSVSERVIDSLNRTFYEAERMASDVAEGSSATKSPTMRLIFLEKGYEIINTMRATQDRVEFRRRARELEQKIGEMGAKISKTVDSKASASAPEDSENAPGRYLADSLKTFLSSEGSAPSDNAVSEIVNRSQQDARRNILKVMPHLAQALLFFSDRDAGDVRIAFARLADLAGGGPIEIPKGLVTATSSLPSREEVSRLIGSLGLGGSDGAHRIWNLWIDMMVNGDERLHGLPLPPSVAASHSMSSLALLRKCVAIICGADVQGITGQVITNDVMYDAVRCAILLGLDPLEAWEVGYALPTTYSNSILPSDGKKWDETIDLFRSRLPHGVYLELAKMAYTRSDRLQEAILKARAAVVCKELGQKSDAFTQHRSAKRAIEIATKQTQYPEDILSPLLTRIDELGESVADAGAHNAVDLISNPVGVDTMLSGAVNLANLIKPIV